MSRSTISAYAALALSVLLNTAALIFARVLVARVPTAVLDLSLVLAMLEEWVFWAAGVAFVVGLVFWVVSLQTIPLSVAYPSAATSYVIIAIVARIAFSEAITVARVIGMIAIITGIVLLYRGQKSSVGGSS